MSDWQLKLESSRLTGRVIVYLLPLLAADCSHRAEDCRYTLTCGNFVASGGSSDAGPVGGTMAGNSPMAGNGTTTDSASLGGIGAGGTLGTGGTYAVDGTGGVLATGGAPTCDPACEGEKSVCMHPELTCVECTGDEHCADKTTRPYCDIDTKSCVECLDNEHCTSAAASACVAGRCSPCTATADCSHIDDRHVCKLSADADAGADVGTCVECTGTDYEACRSDAGPSYVCDSQRNECSDKQEHTAKLCEACVSDAQCHSDSLCVQEVFKTNKIDAYFCLPRLGTGNATDCTRLAPYVKTLELITIDGTRTTVCSPRMTTCEALNQLGRKSCASPTGTPDDSLCGIAPGEDSKCAQYGAGYQCTIPCINDDDCLGLSCTNGTPNKLFCNLL